MENFLPSPALSQAVDVLDRPFAAGVLVVRLSGAIGPDEPINAATVRRQLFEGRDFRHLHVEITSTGGKSSEAFEIYDMLRALPVPVSARASGMCLSGGMIIFMAADLRIAAAATEFLIHPAGLSREDMPERSTAASLRSQADSLARGDLRVAQLFADRTGGPVDWFLKEQETEDSLSEVDAIATGLIHEFEGISGPPRPGWPAAVRAAIAAGGIYFPDWLRSENYFAACRCTGSLFGMERAR